MNHVAIIGRLTKDPEVRQAGETKVARYTLAVDRRGKRDEADFISCVAFNKGADFAEKYLKKGTKIAVEGRLQTGSYDKNGTKIYTTDVIVDSHEFVVGRTEEAPAPKAPSNDATGFMQIPKEIDEELPFV